MQYNDDAHKRYAMVQKRYAFVGATYYIISIHIHTCNHVYSHTYILYPFVFRFSTTIQYNIFCIICLK